MKKSFYCLMMIGFVTCGGARGAELASVAFETAAGGEAVLVARLSTPGYSWEKDQWSPPLDVVLDGGVVASLIPVRGEEVADYKIFLGPVAAGSHTAGIADPARTQRKVHIDLCFTTVYGPEDKEYIYLKHAPVLLGRADNERTDTPLLMWVVESIAGGDRTLTYTMVWTNEDAGTPTAELMSRYGRTVDIEYIYKISFDASGAVVSETYQGRGHEELHFKGRKIGDHPVLRTCTVNNMVTDEGESPFVFAYFPVMFDDGGSRERMLDLEPWISRVAYEELVREKKLTKTTPDPFRMRIDDPRRYALVDIETEPLFSGPGIEVALKLEGDSNWYTADQGVGSMRLKRAGGARVGILLPRGASPDRIEGVRIRAVGDPGGRVNILSLGPVTMLNGEFKPFKKEVAWKKTKVVTVGGKPLLVPASDVK